MKIRLCKHNRWSAQLLQQLQIYPDLDIKIKDCIKQCKKCADRPLLKVNKQIISAKSSEDLFSQLAAIINENKA